MKAFLTVILLSVAYLSSSALARESSVSKTYEPFICSIDDPLCGELPKPQEKKSTFERLKFERVIDGDTFVASGRKIRVWGINAPEKNTPAFTASSWLLQGLITDGELTCKLVDIDKYKREVMHCLIDGLDIASMMVKLGMARDYTKYSGGYYQQEQQQAKAANRGIWKLPEE